MSKKPTPSEPTQIGPGTYIDHSEPMPANAADDSEQSAIDADPIRVDGGKEGEPVRITKPKKPRTESPVQLASRAFQRMCDLQAQRSREAVRHAEHVAKIDGDIAALEAELDGMSPEVGRFFEAMRTAAEGAS